MFGRVFGRAAGRSSFDRRRRGCRPWHPRCDFGTGVPKYRDRAGENARSALIARAARSQRRPRSSSSTADSRCSARSPPCVSHARYPAANVAKATPAHPSGPQVVDSDAESHRQTLGNELFQSSALGEVAIPERRGLADEALADHEFAVLVAEAPRDAAICSSCTPAPCANASRSTPPVRRGATPGRESASKARSCSSGAGHSRIRVALNSVIAILCACLTSSAPPETSSG